MILQGVNLTIQPLGVGYANRPKKAEMGGVRGVFPIYTPACLASFGKNMIFELSTVKNCISRLCTDPLGDPPPPAPNT